MPGSRNALELFLSWIPSLYMPGCRSIDVLFRTSRVLLRTVMAATFTGGKPARGSFSATTPCTGAGEIVSAPGLYWPTMRIVAPLFMVRFDAFPFVASAPPLAELHAELMCIDPSRITVGPPERRTEGQPRWPFGHEGFDGSSSTTE